MKFNTHFDRIRSLPEINSGECLVERAGYLSAQKRIENMILAGQRLVDYRKSQYDFNENQDIDEDFYDPTRDNNFDMADASKMSNDAFSRIRARAKAGEEARQAEREAAEKALQEAQEPPD